MCDNWFNDIQRREADERVREYADKYGFDVIERHRRHRATFRCRQCGRYVTKIYNFKDCLTCFPCQREANVKAARRARGDALRAKAAANKAKKDGRRLVAIYQKARRAYEKAAEKRRIEEKFSEVEKECCVCGATFKTIYHDKKYCSDGCRRKAYGKCGSARRAKNATRATGAEYEFGISLKKLYVRDKGTCYLCGCLCDWDDKSYGYSGPTYPSIDHVTALSRGGSHTWANVRLACCSCNSHKRDQDLCVEGLKTA